MVVIATFSKPEEAHRLGMRLKAGGIQAFIRDENTIQMDWLYSDAMGGVRVEVADEDVEATREFLAADDGISAEDSEAGANPADG